MDVKEQSAGAAYQRENPLEAEERIGLVQRWSRGERAKTRNRTHTHVQLSTCGLEDTQKHMFTHGRHTHAHTDMKVLQENKTCSMPRARG